MSTAFTLKIILPDKIFTEVNNVRSMTAETGKGSFGILAHRLDCTAALVPGIVSYQTAEGQTCYLAVDEAILVKCGTEVRISTRNAIFGKELAELHDLVKREFKNRDQQEVQVRNAMLKLETSFLRTFEELRKG
ncbi:MAG: F0F1 ATP synthase subunit epsilon [Bacteroidetes bacterium]|nr:F0F1 ATP synthase subunit epsilon [Bacteroidota bacterium]